MAKKCACVVLAALLMLPMAGCWSYRGLNEITIVAGIAIDKGEKSRFKLSFEFIDISFGGKDQPPESKIMESEGDTLFEAVRLAKLKVKNKLYFGHTQLLIISEELARKEDIGTFLDFIMRDGEARETMLLCISQDDSAQDILTASGIDENILSIKIQKILENDNEVSATTVDVAAHDAFEVINSPGKDLALAAVRTVDNDNESIPEVNGIAVFKDRKLVGYLSPEDTKYYLFCMGKVQGGFYTFSSDDKGKDDATLEIAETQVSKSVKEKDGAPVIEIRIQCIGFLGEFLHTGVELNLDKVRELQELAAKQLQEDIEKLIKKVQSEYKADIFGFGCLVHRRNFSLWETIKNRWDSMFQDVEVNVKVEVTIANTASLAKS